MARKSLVDCTQFVLPLRCVTLGGCWLFHVHTATLVDVGGKYIISAPRQVVVGSDAVSHAVILELGGCNLHYRSYVVGQQLLVLQLLSSETAIPGESPNSRSTSRLPQVSVKIGPTALFSQRSAIKSTSIIQNVALSDEICGMCPPNSNRTLPSSRSSKNVHANMSIHTTR